MLVLLGLGVDSSACRCSNILEVKKAIHNADLVVTGKILDAKVVTIWSDTSVAVSWFAIVLNKGIINSTMVFPDWISDVNFTTIQKADYRTEVIKNYKGGVGIDTVIIRTGFGHGDCGFEFKKGQRYLIFANDEERVKYYGRESSQTNNVTKNIFRTSICYRTKELSFANEDIAILENK